MTTQTISKRSDEPGTPAAQPIDPGPGGSAVTATGTVTTTYNATLTGYQGLVQIQVSVQGLLPEDVFVALYNGPITNPDSGYVAWTYVEQSNQTLKTTYPWGSGWYVGLSQKSYNGGDSSYTLICSAGPT